MVSDSALSDDQKRQTGLMLGLCLLATLLEGIDIQSIGVAAPKLLPEFGVNPSQAGFLFSASTFGLFVGALVGGVLSDRIGRKWVLVGSIVAFGAFALLTIVAPNLNMLILVRFLTGFGLGGAMPNLIALVSENAPDRWRTPLTTAVWAGTPAGGVIAAQIGAVPGLDWRWIFIVGGVLPIVVAPLIAWLLPESRSFAAAKTGEPVAGGWFAALFGEGRASRTVPLWVGHFFTLLILFLLLNWLPSLLAGRGFSKSAAALSSSAYNLGAVGGALSLAVLLGFASRRLMIPAIFAGMAVGLVGIAFAGTSLAMTLLAAMIAGVFVIGGQYVLYGVTPEIYPTRVRGTGVGAAVAIGRLGGISGPIVAGQVLSLGYPLQTLMLGLVPLVLIAGIGVMIALRPGMEEPA